MSTPIPSCLIKLGVKQATDNVSSGEMLNPISISRSFVMLYRTELEAKIIRRTGPANPTKGDLPCAP